jgi:hypothetical protein
MSREPTPALRAAAEELFAACRSEQPSAELARRIALLGERDAVHSVVRPSVRAPARQPQRWLVAALVLTLGCGVAWLSLRSEEPRIAISAEQTRAPAATEARPVTSGSAPPVASSSAPPVLEREAAEPVAPAPLRAPPRSKTRTPAPPTVRAPEPATPQPPTPRPSLARDLQELMQIRSILRAGDGARALQLLDQRAQTGGELEAEATLLRIEALASVGKRAEASELARRFVVANPNSALTDRAKAFAQ